MPKLSQMPPPAHALTGLELTPLLQGGGADGNVGLPLLAYGQMPRGNVLALRVPMQADLSATADADPGAGKVRWNHATPGSASILYIDDATTASGDLSALWATLHVGGFIYLQGAATSEARDNLQKWAITSVTDAAGYGKVGVTLVASYGTFVEGDVLELTIQQPTPSPGLDRNVVTTVTSSGGTATLDLSLGDYFIITLTENTTIVVTNPPAAGSHSLRITQHASAAMTVTFPASFLKQGGGDFVVSTALGARDRIIFTHDDAGTSYDADLGKAYA